MKEQLFPRGRADEAKLEGVIGEMVTSPAMESLPYLPEDQTFIPNCQHFFCRHHFYSDKEHHIHPSSVWKILICSVKRKHERRFAKGKKTNTLNASTRTDNITEHYKVTGGSIQIASWFPGQDHCLLFSTSIGWWRRFSPKQARTCNLYSEP